MSAVVKPDEIRSERLATALAERYLAYALSTITQRPSRMCATASSRCIAACCTPCACSALNPAAGFKKCARVVGDVIGKYHPMATWRSTRRWCAWPGFCLALSLDRGPG